MYEQRAARWRERERVHTQSLFARVVFFLWKTRKNRFSRLRLFARAKTLFKDLLSCIFNPIEERDRSVQIHRARVFLFLLYHLETNASLPSSKEQQYQTYLYLIIVSAGDEQRLIAVKIHPSYRSVVFVESID